MSAKAFEVFIRKILKKAKKEDNLHELTRRNVRERYVEQNNQKSLSKDERTLFNDILDMLLTEVVDESVPASEIGSDYDSPEKKVSKKKAVQIEEDEDGEDRPEGEETDSSEQDKQDSLAGKDESKNSEELDKPKSRVTYYSKEDVLKAITASPESEKAAKNGAQSKRSKAEQSDDSSNEDSEQEQPARKRQRKKAAAIVDSDDSGDDADEKTDLVIDEKAGGDKCGDEQLNSEDEISKDGWNRNARTSSTVRREISHKEKTSNNKTSVSDTESHSDDKVDKSKAKILDEPSDQESNDSDDFTSTRLDKTHKEERLSREEKANKTDSENGMEEHEQPEVVDNLESSDSDFVTSGKHTNPTKKVHPAKSDKKAIVKKAVKNKSISDSDSDANNDDESNSNKPEEDTHGISSKHSDNDSLSIKSSKDDISSDEDISSMKTKQSVVKITRNKEAEKQSKKHNRANKNSDVEESSDEEETQIKSKKKKVPTATLR